MFKMTARLIRGYIRSVIDVYICNYKCFSCGTHTFIYCLEHHLI